MNRTFVYQRALGVVLAVFFTLHCVAQNSSRDRVQSIREGIELDILRDRTNDLRSQMNENERQQQNAVQHIEMLKAQMDEAEARINRAEEEIAATKTLLREYRTALMEHGLQLENTRKTHAVLSKQQMALANDLNQPQQTAAPKEQRPPREDKIDAPRATADTQDKTSFWGKWFGGKEKSPPRVKMPPETKDSQDSRAFNRPRRYSRNQLLQENEEQQVADPATNEMQPSNVSLAAAEQALAQGKFGRAETLYNQYLEQFPESDEALYGLALTSYYAGDTENAVRYAVRILSRNRTHPEAIGLWANILVQQGDFQKAERLYKRALQSNSAAPGLWYNLGYVQEQMGNESASLDSYQRVLQIEPAHAQANYKVALYTVLQDQPDLNQARFYYERSLESGGQPDSDLEAVLY